MTNESSNAEEGVFVLDPDDQDAIVAIEDTVFDENEEVPEELEHEQQQQQWQPGEGPADPRRRTTVLTKKQIAFLRIMKRRAKFLDRSIWTAIIAPIPIAGDVLHITFSYILIVRPAVKARIPRPLRQRMMANLAASALVGLIPFAGHLFRSRYRANLRNVRMLEIYFIKRGQRIAEADAARAAQTAAPEEETRMVTVGEDNLPAEEQVEEQREGAEKVSDENPGVGNTSDGDKEKEKNTTTDVDDKDQNTTAAPDSADAEKATHLRPARNNLEYVQNRDSRFIEDVS